MVGTTLWNAEPCLASHPRAGGVGASADGLGGGPAGAGAVNPDATGAGGGPAKDAKPAVEAAFCDWFR